MLKNYAGNEEEQFQGAQNHLWLDIIPGKALLSQETLHEPASRLTRRSQSSFFM